MKQQLITNKQIAAAFLSLVVIGGLLMHDVKLGSVTSIAALSVASAAGYSALPHYSFDSGDHHIHVHSLFSSVGSNGLGSGLSKLPNKSDREKKYITQKRFSSGSNSSGEYYWPSI